MNSPGTCRQGTTQVKSTWTNNATTILKRTTMDFSNSTQKMEEEAQAVMENKQSFLTLLKQSLTIPFKNPNFIIFTFITSLPLFYFLVVYEILFQETMIETVEILKETIDPSDRFGYGYFYAAIDSAEKLIGEVSQKFLLLCFFYPGILHFLDLFNAIASIDMASLIYKESEGINLWQMLSRLVRETRLKGPLITSIYVLLLSHLVSIGLLSLIVYAHLTSSGNVFVIIFLLLFIALSAKYIEWSAIWNMGVVISVLEDKQGDVALFISSYLTRGSRRCGFLIMLVFFVWRLALRLSCLYMGWDKRGSGIAVTAVHITFVCIANVLKWLIFVVYFHDFKKRRSSKKIDEEEGESSKVTTTTLSQYVSA